MGGPLVVWLLVLGTIGAVSADAAVSARPQGRSTAASARREVTLARSRAESHGATEPVIVILRAQFRPALASRRAAAARVAAIHAEQAPLLVQLRLAHATRIRTYSLVDGFAATVTPAERARLAADPAVEQVLPDATISVDTPTEPAAGVAPRTRSTAKAGAGTAPKVRAAITVPQSPSTLMAQACLSTQSTPLLEPEGLSLTGVMSSTADTPTARALGYDGTGVKVGFIADGLDPNNPNLIDTDGNGKSILSKANNGDYEDFSGDGPGQPTGGGEAFIDANTIGGQGAVYNVEGFGAQSTSIPCWVEIEGVAPSASLVGLDAVGTYEDTTTSNYLSAINYAVEDDNVNVLNESFSSNSFPDLATLNVIKLFNDWAVQQGVFVTVATGDAGPFNTIGSPATDPAVLSVGASTDFRFYAMTNYALDDDFAYSLGGANQISQLSSSGFEENGGTVDLVAPGDLSFASCDASPEFSSCVNALGQPSDVEESGGTSQSAAFAAGVAALVIQAYAQAHAGHAPTPALIKQILTSTATDIGAPAQEQGAGLINALGAVQLAASIAGNGITPTPTGNSLLVSTSQLRATALPSRVRRFTVSVTNAAASAQTVALSTRAYGPESPLASGTVNLDDDTDPEVLLDNAGIPQNYGMVKFTVPPDTQRLVGSIAWPVNASYCETGGCATDPNSRVRMILIDPTGQLMSHSIPQGSGAYGTVEVDQPAAGDWTGVIFGDVASQGGTPGTVYWQVGTESTRSFGTLSTSTLSLSPGQQSSFTYTVATPQAAGDTAGSILLNPSQGSDTTIPVTVRSLIGGANHGWFAGTLTGGNGRPNGEGQVQYYQFLVPAGTRDVAANLAIAADPQDPVGEYLVSPDGQTLGYGQNSAAEGASNQPSRAASAYVRDPAAGLWTLIITFAEPTAGDRVSELYAGHILFDSVRVHGSGVPDSSLLSLPVGSTRTATVWIRNMSLATQDYFVDPRLDRERVLPLSASGSATPGAATVTLPLVGAAPTFVVPSETSALTASSVVPSGPNNATTMFDLTPVAGDPDLSNVTDLSDETAATALCTNPATRTFAALGGQVTPGKWIVVPSECGPWSNPAPTAQDTVTLMALTKAFDTSVTSSTGDGWLGAIDPSASFSPLVLAPGAVGKITVSFTPTAAQAGDLVSGELYVDTLENDVPPPAYAQSSGDELAAIPYGYRVAGS